MYHIVYLTTNLVNNKIYVGVHSTYNLDDGYLGSGRILKSAVKKYGRKHFKREVLYYCLESNHAYEFETQIVDLTFINSKDTYNTSIGGKGGSKIMTEERRLNISKSKIGKPAPNKGIPMSDAQKKKLSDTRKKMDITYTEEHKKKISEISILRGCSKGINNGMFGKTHSEETKVKFKEKHKCIKCGKEMNLPNLYKYHGINGEKCKNNIVVID